MRRRIAMCGRVLALFALALCASAALAEFSRTLRLMPRVSAADPEATVSEAQLWQWEAIAGFALRPTSKTNTGAWLIDLPAEIPSARIAGSLHVINKGIRRSRSIKAPGRLGLVRLHCQCPRILQQT